MARSRVIGFIVAGSLLFSSTASVAAAAPPPQVSPWAALTALTGGAPAAVLCGSAAVAAQAPAGGCVLPAVDAAAPPPAQSAPPQPIPVPPVEGPAPAFGVDPLLLALAAVAAGVGLYFLLRKHHANSPG